MLVLAVNISIGLLFGICIGSFLVGYMLRSSFIKKCRKKLNSLERDMLRDNAKILELEKEKAELMRSLKTGPGATTNRIAPGG